MIFKIEKNDLNSLVREINKFEESGEGFLIGSISNYSKEGSLTEDHWNRKQKSLELETIFYAILRKENKDEF
jgi:hypothetical protein